MACCRPDYFSPCRPPVFLPALCGGPTGATGPSGPSLAVPTSLFQAQVSATNSQALSITGSPGYVVFNAVRTGNADGAYSTSTGYYTALQTGYYYFDVQVVVNNTTTTATFFTVSLNVNGVVVATQTLLASGAIGQVTSASLSSTQRLIVSDVVYVTCVSSGTAGRLTFGSLIYPLAAATTFQGWSYF